jgi:hypothetical protein
MFACGSREGSESRVRSSHAISQEKKAWSPGSRTRRFAASGQVKTTVSAA